MAKRIERLRHDVRFDARLRAFGERNPRTHRVLVTHDLDVRVWDPEAQHFTTCVSLSEGTRRRLVREAAAVLRERYPA